MSDPKSTTFHYILDKFPVDRNPAKVQGKNYMWLRYENPIFLPANKKSENQRMQLCDSAGSNQSFEWLIYHMQFLTPVQIKEN